MSFLEIYQQSSLFKYRRRLKGSDEIIFGVQEKELVLSELEEIFKENEDFLNYDRVILYLAQDIIQRVSIKKKIDTKYTDSRVYFPIVEMKDSTEHVILSPSDNIQKNKSTRQSFLDAASVCKKINQLIGLKKQ